MSFTWDPATQARIDKRKKRERIIYVAATILIFAIAIGIRLLIVGGYNECFWAQDVGTCLALRNK